MSDPVKRLREIAQAVADGNHSELTMRIPADPDRDADIVVSWAADEIERLRGLLDTYGDHYIDCGSLTIQHEECDCGFSAALAGEKP